MTRLSVLLAFVLVACGPAPRSDGSGTGGGSSGGGSGGGSGCGADCMNKCPNGTQTDLRGVVTAPNGIDPVPGAVVYVPYALPEFPEEVSCDVCGELAGNAVVQARTNPDGSFLLQKLPTAENQPPNTAVTVVVQKGRFRKVSQVPIANACTENDLGDSDLFRLPQRHNPPHEHLPKIAIATGDYDKMECVLRSLGIADDQFGAPAADKRIHLYNASLHEEDSSWPSVATLFDDPNLLSTYNIVFLNCGNSQESVLSDASFRTRLLDYVGAGGRLYVTDQAYDFVEQVFPEPIDFAPDATTNPSQPEEMNAAQVGNDMAGTDATLTDQDMITWLDAVEARSGDTILKNGNQIYVTHFLIGWVMQYAVHVSETVKMWLFANIDGGNPSMDPLTTTFDYNQCGRVLYSSYHTLGRESAGLCGGLFPPCPSFPAYCETLDLSPQERVLEYLIFHVADCVGPIE